MAITIKELIEKEEVLRVYNGLDVMWRRTREP